MASLFLDNAARDTWAGIARGIRLHVVGLAMHHEGGSAIAEQRMRVVPEIDAPVGDGRSGAALGIRGEVQHVARVMTLRVFEPMFLAIRIEVAPRRLEVGPFAFRNLMEVDGVLSGR